MILTLGSAMAAHAAPETDPWMGARVKAALIGAEGVDAVSINVDTLDGVAILHGDVSTEAEKTRAGAIAVDVEGVLGVRNLLAVVAPHDRDDVGAVDERIAIETSHALSSDWELAGSLIDVKSVHGGIVLLTGQASSLDAHHRALAVARGVKGALRVESEIESPDLLGDRALWEAGGIERPESRSALVRFASDLWITAKAKVRLMRETGLSPLAIDVDTEEGIVTLSGIVETRAQKDAAEEQLMQVDGVVRVANYLQVVPMRSTSI